MLCLLFGTAWLWQKSVSDRAGHLWIPQEILYDDSEVNNYVVCAKQGIFAHGACAVVQLLSHGREDCVEPCKGNRAAVLLSGVTEARPGKAQRAPPVSGSAKLSHE
jgi:hypothetical protein